MAKASVESVFRGAAEGGAGIRRRRIDLGEGAELHRLDPLPARVPLWPRSYHNLHQIIPSVIKNTRDSERWSVHG